MKVDKKDIPNDVVKVEDKNYTQRDGFDIHKALKLNVFVDKETEANKPTPQRKEKTVKDKAPIPMREPSSRAKRPSSMLVYPSEVQGSGFVFVGGIKHYLK